MRNISLSPILILVKAPRIGSCLTAISKYARLLLEGWGPHNKYGPVNLAANEINGAFVLNDMLAKILVDKQTVQEAADWAQDKMTKMTEETRAQLNK